MICIHFTCTLYTLKNIYLRVTCVRTNVLEFKLKLFAYDVRRWKMSLYSANINKMLGKCCFIALVNVFDFASFDLTKLPVRSCYSIFDMNKNIYIYQMSKWVTKPSALSTQCYLLSAWHMNKVRRERQDRERESEQLKRQQQLTFLPRHSLWNEQNVALAPQTCISTLITHMCVSARSLVCEWMFVFVFLLYNFNVFDSIY